MVRKGTANEDPGDYYEALRPYGITKREAQVARLLSWHHTYAEIAEVVNRSESEVKRRARNLRMKLGANNKRELGNRVRRATRP